MGHSTDARLTAVVYAPITQGVQHVLSFSRSLVLSFSRSLVLSFSRSLVLSFSLLTVAGAANAGDFHGFYVTDGDPCGLSDLTYTDNQVYAFRDVVDGWGWSHLLWGNSNVTASDVTDAARKSYGDDDSATGIDGADVGYISTHGGHECNSSTGTYRSWIAMGSATDNCFPKSGDSSSPWLYDDSAHMIFLDACRTVQKCVANNGGYDNAHWNNMNMIAGFHGSSYDRYGQIAALSDYVSTSRYSGVGQNWLDERVLWNIIPDLDQCPTAVVFGSSTTNMNNWFYNAGIDDWFSTGTGMRTFYYLDNCDPRKGDKL